MKPTRKCSKFTLWTSSYWDYLESLVELWLVLVCDLCLSMHLISSKLFACTVFGTFHRLFINYWLNLLTFDYRWVRSRYHRPSLAAKCKSIRTKKYLADGCHESLVTSLPKFKVHVASFNENILWLHKMNTPRETFRVHSNDLHQFQQWKFCSTNARHNISISKVGWVSNPIFTVWFSECNERWGRHFT